MWRRTEACRRAALCGLLALAAPLVAQEAPRAPGAGPVPGAGDGRAAATARPAAPAPDPDGRTAGAPAGATRVAPASGSLLGREAPPPLAGVKAGGGPVDREPNELLVFSPDLDSAERLRRELAGAGIGVRSRRVLGALGLVLTRLRLPPGTDSAALAQRLGSRHPRSLADVNHRYRLQAADVRRYARRLTATEGAGDTCGAGGHIGLVDTGVDGSHPALRGQALVQRSFLAVGEQPAPADHGTALAALMIGRADAGALAGLVPGARLSVAACARRRAGGSDMTAACLIEALDWLAGRDVQVINLSLAGPRNRLLDVAAARLTAAGRLLVAAAGNGGPRAPPAYPAALPGVLAVTAVDADLRVYRLANRGDYIDLAAPGVDLWLARSGGRAAFHSGTSFAAPFVTALLVRGLAAGQAPGAARSRLLRDARDLGAPGPDPVYGHGLARALRRCP